MVIMVLDEVLDGVSQMPAPVMYDFQAGRWGRLRPEGEFTTRIATEFGRNQNRKIWTAMNTHQFIPNNAPENSWSSPFFFGHSKNDIAWAEGLDYETPTTILEIKMRSSAAPSQDHYRFYSDVCAVAADILDSENNLRGYCAFITDIGERERTRWFNDMTPVEEMRIEIEPSAAINNRGPEFPEGPNRPYWINQETGLIRPEFQSAFNKIFSHSTYGRLVGVYRRAGNLRISCSVTQAETENGYWIIQYEITNVELIGTELQINEWWP